MKKFISLVLIFVTVCLTAVILPACSEKVFTVPEDCCIVSTRGADLSAIEESATCEYIDSDINGIEKEEFLKYYCVTKGAKIEISVEFWHYGNIGNKYSHFVLTGYEIDGEFVECDYGIYDKFTVTESCHIECVYETYSQTDIIFVPYIDLSEQEYYDINRYLDADYNIKNKNDVYYIRYNGGTFYEIDSWETNLTVNFFGCIYRPFPNPYFPNENRHYGSSWAGYVASLTVENFLDDEGNDKTVAVNIGKSESGKYFVESVYYNEDKSEGVYGNIFIGDNYLELYLAN